MLQGCAQNEDPLAVIQILGAVYLAGSTDGSPYRGLASLFPKNEVSQYRATLEKLGAKAKTFPLGPETLTLQGLFMEREGKTDKAQDLYVEAIERCHFKYNPKSNHPMQIPLVAPWNALGYLLKDDQDPRVQAQAKTYFMRGAVEGNDPLSYYELAAFEERSGAKWLQYTSKAAASGHRQATVDLANFYQEASSTDSPVLENNSMRKALGWLLSWKSGSVETLAREWLQAASNMGHKPSTLQLASYCESMRDAEGAKEHYRKLVQPPSSTNQTEEWPELVQVGKRRLAGIKT
jgi:TPR repeat protein